MAKRLKHFNEIQIMHNGMEEIGCGIGSIAVFSKSVQSGEKATFRITYTVGEKTIHPNGVIRFTIPFGFTKPQIDMPIYPGYTTVSTTRDGVTLKPFHVENEWWKRGPDRSKTENVSEHVGTHVWVRVSGKPLTEGDEVVLTYGDTSYTQQAASCVCPVAGYPQFDVAVDCKGQLEAPYSGYYLVPNPPVCLVTPGKAVALEAVIPSDVVCGTDFIATVFAVDALHNLVTGHTGSLRCFMDGEEVYAGVFAEEDCGVKKITLTPRRAGVIRIAAADQDGHLTAESNPAVSHSEGVFEHRYWGDMHGHTGIQWGRGSGRSYYEYARDVAALDFCALTDPDAGRYTNNNETAHLSLSCYMTDKQWKEIQDINKEFYESGKFVPILGYEYHNDAPAPEFGGDRNVYYGSYDEPIRRCVDPGSYTPAQLWEQLKEQKTKALTVPHHTAKKVMLGSWEIHDEEIQRLVEIYSGWGNSECEGCERPIIGGALYEGHSVHHALAKGYVLGFIAGSDTHAGNPGYSHWVFSEALESYRGGLTCVKADKLDQESLFEALRNRRVYATTGERILLDFSINGRDMGSILSCEDNPERVIKVKVIGTAEIDVVEIISMGRSVYAHRGSDSDMEFVFTDSSWLKDGWAYYYARVYQKDKAIAWSSPIWLF